MAQWRVLASHQCGPGSISARYHMLDEFVVGSRPCSEGFYPGSLGSRVFLPPQTEMKLQFHLGCAYTS